jgi:hypothetical protein
MSVRSQITPTEIEDFLIAIHFGKQDLLAACIRFAYRDLQRTVRGVSKHDKGGIPERVRRLTEEAVRAQDQPAFDAWHQAACADVIAAFREIGYERFTVGHAQKWFNMTLKYIFVLGDRAHGYEHLHAFCHVPLDQFLIAAATPLGFQPLPGTGAWSTLDDYDVYMDRQRWFRERFAEAPLVTEFRLWGGYVKAMAPRDGADASDITAASDRT